jgi:malonate-semialdehyde dehydrogenase (acetylating)/methylmalonate-semialdehyde dehydrogenase
VHGDKEAVDALLNHRDIKAISFVGSTPIAKYIYETAARNGKRVQALGGAKNHAVVLPDMVTNAHRPPCGCADRAAYGSAGERCMAISAVVAVGAAADPLVAKLKDKASKLKIGPGDGKVDGQQPDMGPLVTRAHRDKVAGYVDKGVAEGAKLVLDGRGFKVTEYQDGHFLGASLFDHVKTDMTIYKDEIFGPVLVVLRTETLDDAIRMINANPYANGTAVFTRSGVPRKVRARDRGRHGRYQRRFRVRLRSFIRRLAQFDVGDQHARMEGAFHTRGKVAPPIRWPAANAPPGGFNMPDSGLKRDGAHRFWRASARRRAEAVSRRSTSAMLLLHISRRIRKVRARDPIGSRWRVSASAR